MASTHLQVLPGWLPMQIACFYGFPKEFTGQGQSVAVISLGGKIDVDELSRDLFALRVVNLNIRVVDVDNDISPEQDARSTLETQLDVQVIGSICPNANITVYRGANPTGFPRAVTRAIEDGNAVISISWGGPEATTADAHEEMEQAFKLAKESNVTVCVASGDNGSADGVADGQAHVDYPASSPHVLACGGSQLQIDLDDNRRELQEVVWNLSSTGGGSTGGGVSEIFDRPPWQVSDIRSLRSGRAGRIVPDVAGVAAAGDYSVFHSTEQGLSNILIGGTSAVAPLWAAFITQANEARVRENKQQLGFINDRLYKLAGQDRSLFFDITAGNNRTDGITPGYEAGKGFDAVTGLGSPMGMKLFEALVNSD